MGKLLLCLHYGNVPHLSATSSLPAHLNLLTFLAYTQAAAAAAAAVVVVCKL